MCGRMLRRISDSVAGFVESLDVIVNRLDSIIRLLVTLNSEVRKMALDTSKLNQVIATIGADVANLSNLYTSAAASNIAAAVDQARKAQASEDQAAIDDAFSKLDQLRQQLENNQPIAPVPTPTNPSPDPTPIPSPAVNSNGGGAVTQP